MSIAFTYLMAYMLETIVSYYYIDRVFIRKITRKETMAIYVISFILQYSASFLKNQALNPILFLTCNILIIVIAYKSKVANAIFHSLVLTVLMAVTEIITGSAIGSIYTNFDAADIRYAIFIYYFIFSKVTYMLIVFGVSKFISKKYKEYENKIGVLFPISIIAAAIFIVMSYFYICNKVELPRECERVLSWCSIMIFLISILAILSYEFSLRNTIKLAEMKLQLQEERNLLEMNEKMEKIYNSQKLIVHDIKNHMRAMRELSEGKQYEELDEYIKNVSDMTEKNRDTIYSHNSLLNNILGRYDSICSSKDIDLCVDINTKNTDRMKSEHITSLFCNLLDNAVEACEKCDDKMIELLLRGQDNYLTISVINSCSTKPEIVEDNYIKSTKNDELEHGFGTKNIKKVVDIYDGDLEYSYDDELEVFKTSILMKV